VVRIPETTKWAVSATRTKSVTTPRSFTNEEWALVHSLQRNGLSEGGAALAVVMVTRRYRKVESELIDMIRQFPSLEQRDVAADAVAELRALGLVEPVLSRAGVELLAAIEDIVDRLSKLLGRDVLPPELGVRENEVESFVRLLGPMKQDIVYESYLHLLRSAHREILLPMLAQPPNQAAVPILKARARSGVAVKVLTASPKVTAEFWGPGLEPIAEEFLAGWREHARGVDNFEVRISDSVSMPLIATSLVIDESLSRVDVFDPRRQRSLEGVMLEIESAAGYELNLVTLIRQAFLREWDLAMPADARWPIIRRAVAHWQLSSGGLLLAAAFAAEGSPVLSGVLASAGGSLLLAELVDNRVRLASHFRRLLRASQGHLD
jgi:hypothetical protein